MNVRFRLGNITESRPVHGQLDHHVSAGRKRDGLRNFTVKIFQVLRLSTKLLAVLRLLVTPIETLLKLPQQFRREPIVSSADFFPPSKLCDSYHLSTALFQ